MGLQERAKAFIARHREWEQCCAALRADGADEASLPAEPVSSVPARKFLPTNSSVYDAYATLGYVSYAPKPLVPGCGGQNAAVAVYATAPAAAASNGGAQVLETLKAAPAPEFNAKTAPRKSKKTWFLRMLSSKSRVGAAAATAVEPAAKRQPAKKAAAWFGAMAKRGSVLMNRLSKIDCFAAPEVK